MTYFVMALALVLGLAQCKKEQVNTPENETKTVNITLNVGGNGGGSRHDINTANGDVDFEDDDVIYVGDGSTYIGTLTHTDDVFSGPINEPASGTEIYFYFVGGLNPSSTPVAGTTPSFTVDISDQSTEMPVLSCNHVTYTSGTTSYSCVLQNQCALVKFTTASGTDDPVHVGGLYTEAQIDFASKTIAHTDTKGFVNLYPDAVDNTAKWAVLLPQTGFDDAEAAIAHVGYTTTIPTIAADGFITGDAAISISTLSNIVYLDWLTGDYTATDGKILTGTLNGEPQPYKINVNTDGATVTLRNSTINGKNDEDNCSWAGITCENNTTLVIEGTNNVTGFYEDYPGIHIASGKTLTIQGTGTLNASSNGGANGWGAGIGGSDLVDCGNIVINSGTIYATGGVWMAGIGGGYNKNCGSITINGGNVTATGGDKAAGIGTGCVIANNTITGGDINISGGTVVATGGIGGAGIGIGYAGGADGDFTGGDINISGGTVVATGGIGAAGIGSGFVFYTYTTSSTCGNISITGGEVTATGGDGGENTSNSFGVNSYFSQPFYGGAGIGTGSSIYTNYEGASNCGTITIGNGVTRVTATKGGGTRPATNSIGKTVGYHDRSTCGTITIGGTVYPNGADANQADGLTFIYPMVTTITWDQTTVGSIRINVNEYYEYTNGIITIEPSTNNAIWSGNSIQLYDTEDNLTFSTSTGNITKIEITFDEMEYDVGIPSSNWTCTDHKLIWTGFSSSVELGCMASAKGVPDPGDEPGVDPGGGGAGIIEPIFQLTYVTKVEFTVRQ